MVITILEAQVAIEKASMLEAAYKKAIEHLDAGIVQTFLLQNSSDPAVWQIVTLWESREKLDAMRQTGETPRGVLIFGTVGAKPRLSIFDVLASANA
jgi:heme-degrading monooxygenase HmoA